MGAGPISRWTITAAVALFLGSCPGGGLTGELGTELTSITVAISATDTPPAVPLEPGTPYFFSKYQGDRTELLELNADGMYRLLDRRHQWVKETDRGTWQPGPAPGEVIMTSAGYFESVQAGVLGVDLVSTSTLNNLTSVSLALADVLTSVAATGGVVTVRDYMMMMRMHPADTSREPQVDGKRAYGPKEQAIIKSDEMEAFASAVKATLAAPTPTSETLTLRKYDGVTYLHVPASTRFPWAGMSHAGGGHIAINRRDPAGRIFETFIQVPHQEYALAATTTQPWLFVLTLQRPPRRKP